MSIINLSLQIIADYLCLYSCSTSSSKSENQIKPIEDLNEDVPPLEQQLILCPFSNYLALTGFRNPSGLVVPQPGFLTQNQVKNRLTQFLEYPSSKICQDSTEKVAHLSNTTHA
ncbi:hypothetical protein [Ekhidna sp.]|uniref:hypothetical protein n=1 Tax=Ekhidna sp. TaxID=2608089 RepID=UPI0032EBA06C